MKVAGPCPQQQSDGRAICALLSGGNRAPPLSDEFKISHDLWFFAALEPLPEGWRITFGQRDRRTLVLTGKHTAPKPTLAPRTEIGDSGSCCSID